MISHAVKGLNIHHSPDLFHVQYEISKGTSVALAGAIRNAGTDHEKCVKAARDALEMREKHEALEKRPVGGRPDFEERIAVARRKEKSAEAASERAESNRKQVTEARRDINRVYHPYDSLTLK